MVGLTFPSCILTLTCYFHGREYLLQLVLINTLVSYRIHKELFGIRDRVILSITRTVMIWLMCRPRSEYRAQ